MPECTNGILIKIVHRFVHFDTQTKQKKKLVENAKMVVAHSFRREELTFTTLPSTLKASPTTKKCNFS